MNAKHPKPVPNGHVKIKIIALILYIFKLVLLCGILLTLDGQIMYKNFNKKFSKAMPSDIKYIFNINYVNYSNLSLL